MSGAPRVQLGNDVEILAYHVVDNIARRAHAIHSSYNLPRSRSEKPMRAARFVLARPANARLCLSDQHILERHRERSRGSVTVPSVGPWSAKLARGLAAERPRTNGVGRLSVQKLLDERGARITLFYSQPNRSCPDAIGA